MSEIVARKDGIGINAYGSHKQELFEHGAMALMNSAVIFLERCELYIQQFTFRTAGKSGKAIRYGYT